MLPLLLFGGATAALAPREPCVELQLQNEAVTAVFDGCTGALASLQRRGGPNLLAGATSASDRGPFALWLDAPPPWVALNALDHGTDTLDGGHRSCSGRTGCIALPNNGSGALTAADCRLVSHSVSRNTIPTLVMNMVPKNTSVALRITLTATFAAAGADPRLRLSLAVRNTGTTARSLQAAFPLLRGVRLGRAHDPDDLGVLHMQTGIPNVSAWGGCAVGGKHISATADSCGGMLGYHTSSLWQQVYAADGSHGLAVIVDDATAQPRMIGRIGEGPATAPASSGAIYSYSYPGTTLAPNASAAPAAALIVPHAGNWRAGAVFYRDWLRSVGAGRNPKSCKVILSWLGRL